MNAIINVYEFINITYRFKSLAARFRISTFLFFNLDTKLCMRIDDMILLDLQQKYQIQH